MSFITGVPHPSAQSLTQHGYDEFNRLASAGKSGQAFSYDYDRYGNRWHQNVTAGSGPAPQYTFNTSNRITTFTYDAAGNLTNDGSHSYTYDAEGRMTAVDGGSTATYVYDAQGRRVRTVVNGTASNVIYDLQGQAVALVNDSGGAVREEVWSPLGNIATYAWDTTFFNHTDWLGTGRAQSNVAGGSAQQCYGLPFGDGLSCTNSEDSPVHFAGLERDSESAVAAGTGLDHAWFRQYSSGQGRWMTPDPAGMAAADPANPQSWNRYAYVMNRPSVATDPLGLFCGPSGCPEPEPPPPPHDANALTAITPDPFQPIGKRTVPHPWVPPQAPGKNNSTVNNVTPPVCFGNVYVLQGNSKNLGQQGAVPGTAVTRHSVAVLPEQWGGLHNGAQLAPFAATVSGIVSTPGVGSGRFGFNGITEVINSVNIRGVPGGVPARNVILQRGTAANGGVPPLVLELNGLSRVPNPVIQPTIVWPGSFAGGTGPCPSGTVAPPGVPPPPLPAGLGGS